MGGAHRRRPKSLTLTWLLANHRAALAYDWRTRFGMPLSAITERRIRWSEAWELTSELLRDPHSHVVAACEEWSYVPSPAQTAAFELLEGWANAKRGKNTTPIKVERPWTRKAPAAVTDDRPARGEEHLEKRRRHLGLVRND